MPTDILFVNMPPPESYYAQNVPHLGMLYVMTGLRHHGYTVSYLDCARRQVRRQQILAEIRQVEPRLIGFSVDTDNLFSVAHFTRELKREYNGHLKIMLGGPASQGHPREIMERCAADVLVIGEGEYSACEVADSLLRGEGKLRDIPGICYRGPFGITETAPRPPIADLDALPFPDRNFLSDPNAYEATMISGRGCPFKCTFCFEGRMGNRYRHRSPENIVAEMEQIVKARSPAFITINDDTFTSEPEQTLEVCRLIRQRFRPWKDLLWFCEARVDVVHKHPELIDAMVEAGVARIQMGVESADLDVLQAYKRLNVKPHLVEEVVGAFHRAGVPSIYCGFILGGPRETMATMERTLAFAKHLLLEVAPGSFECRGSFLTPLPGTDIRARPEAYGIRLLDPDLLTSSNFNYCTVETEALTQETITNFNHHFFAEIDAAIRGLVPNLPWELVDKHWRLHQIFHMSTAYWERLAGCGRLAQYLDLVGEGKFDRGDALSDEELLERFPTRIATPVRMEAGQLMVRKAPSELTLNGLGARIYALSSGKLTTAEVVQELSKSLEGGPPEEVLRADVIEFVRLLDRNYAIFLKDF